MKPWGEIDEESGDKAFKPAQVSDLRDVHLRHMVESLLEEPQVWQCSFLSRLKLLNSFKHVSECSSSEAKGFTI